MKFSLALVALPLAAAASDAAASFKARCEALPAKVKIDGVHVNFVQYVAGGANVSLAGNPPSCGQTSQAVAGSLCRLAMAVDTSSSSQITLEAWLPANFSGRFLSTGNGGLGGCIQYADVAYGAGQSFATVGANNGHNGTSGAPFLNHPETIRDFAWRSVHTGVVVGKQITDIFYGQGQRKKSYYLGCSTGGREGQKSAEMFPNDFDGIVAGSPAIDFVGLLSWSTYLSLVTGFDNSSSGFVTAQQWGSINAEILRQCDGIDGAVDGIIEDTDLCQPDLTPLLCGSSGSTANCLNQEQYSRASRVYEPLYGPNSTMYYPRMQPGSELLASIFIYNGSPFIYGSDWFKYVVYNDSSWDATKVTYSDFDTLVAQNPSNIRTFASSLAPFQKAGGKLITYHGLQDALISSDNSERYWKYLANGMNYKAAELDEFYRYFRISGMNHCSGGPGAWSIGQVAAEGVIGDPKTRNPQDNVLLALVDWVEKGNAPEYIRGTKYNNDNVADGVAFTRKHCKFPARNVYVGPANYTDENAWKCILYQGQEFLTQLPSGSV